MNRIFGHAWQARYGIKDDGVWESIIAQLDRDEVKRGLQHMLNDWTDSFPPTPAQFKAVARIPPAHRPFDRSKALEHQASDAETAKEHLAALRGLVS
jgi:hypothetical protein